MKRWIAVAVLTAACGSKQQPSCDMSSPDSMLAIYKKLTGSPGSGECVRWIEGFEMLAYVGHFAADAGCIDEELIWKCAKVGEEDTAKILQANGWKDAAKREELAKKWLAKDFEVLWKADAESEKDFTVAGKTFSPATIASKDGGVVVNGWSRNHGVTIAGKVAAYRQIRIDFTSAGDMKYSPGGDSFTAR